MSKFDEVHTYLQKNRFTWLVTGAAGFIGSNLVERLLVLNQRVIGLDNLATGHRYNVDEAINDAANILASRGMRADRDLFTFIEGDICDLGTCKNACENVDYVLHEAAIGSVPRSVEDPIRTNRANIDGFLNMLLSARDADVKRFVFAASSSTYGDHPDLPKVEENIGKPLSPYAVTKLVNELYADVFARVYGFKTIGLRYFNIFGKRQDPEGAYAAVIPKWISNMLKGEAVYINGDGETSRDFCFIENAIQMNFLAALTNREEALGQVYNVALNHRTSLNELYKMIQERLAERVGSLITEMPVYREFRPADVRHSQADISKAMNLLEYDPTHTISDGLDLAMDWYVRSLSHENC